MIGALVLLVMAAQPPIEQFLNRLTPVETNVLHQPGITITAKGKVSSHGIYQAPLKNFASSCLRYELNDSWEWFSGGVGLTDHGGEIVEAPMAPPTVRIVGDGVLLWSSDPIKQRSVVFPFKVDVSAIKILELYVDCPGIRRGSNVGWFEPILSSSGVRFDPHEVEKQLKAELPKATPIECLSIARRALKVANASDDRSVVNSAKRIAIAAAKKTGNQQFANTVLASIKEIR
jgi:hypothetical protein